MTLSQNDVHVWVIDLPACQDEVAAAYQILGDDERNRAEKFRFPADKDRFVIARASLRKILATYLEEDPWKIRFSCSPDGKPVLDGTRSDLSFNTSRSHEKALVACTRGREIGVDVERIRQDLDVEDLAQRFFTAEENKKLRAFPKEERHLAFLRCWTCKEAYVKAIGKGLSIDLAAFDVSAALASPAIVLSTKHELFDIEGWSLITLGKDSVQGYFSAVVTRGSEVQVSLQHWG